MMATFNSSAQLDNGNINDKLIIQLIKDNHNDKYGKLVFINERKDFIYMDSNVMKINNTENSFTIAPLQYDRNNNTIIKKMFKIIIEAMNCALDPNMDDTTFNIIIPYNTVDIVLDYTDSYLTLLIRDIHKGIPDIDNNENIVIKYVFMHDFEIKDLYKFFNTLLYYIDHKSDIVMNAFYDMKTAWTNIDLKHFSLYD